MSERQLKWDYRFLDLCKQVSAWSKDPSTKVGAAIVRPDMTVASVGYNGFPRHLPDDEVLYSNREEKYSRIVHGEMNALLFTREAVQGYTLYTYPFMPCDRCFVTMLQAGITRFVSPQPTDEQLSRWGVAFDKTRKYAKEAGVSLIELEYV
jgi:dCMP deaminase